MAPYQDCAAASRNTGITLRGCHNPIRRQKTLADFPDYTDFSASTGRLSAQSVESVKSVRVKKYPSVSAPTPKPPCMAALRAPTGDDN